MTQTDTTLADAAEREIGQLLVEAAAARIAKSQGLNWKEVCAYERDEPDNQGPCDSSTCVAAHFEDHDPKWARKTYRIMARAALASRPEAPPAEGERVARLERTLAEIVENARHVPATEFSSWASEKAARALKEATHGTD